MNDFIIGFLKIIILFTCIIFFFPIIFLIFEHIISEEDSILTKLLDLPR